MPHFSYWLIFLMIVVANARSSEVQILLNLKNALHESNTSVFNSWNYSNSICNYAGIACNSRGSVKEIKLSNHNLTGNLPFDSLCKLQYLEKISFQFNFLYGMIAKDLNHCVKLRFLNLGNNIFSGTFPDISFLNQLQYLHLDNSGISGRFPWKSFKNLTNLVSLNLENNVFHSSMFPSEVLKLDKLNLLYLSNCSIAGKIPVEIGNLSRLIELTLSDNQRIHGEIPAEIGKLQSLINLDLSRNYLTGKLPITLSNLTKLEFLDASVNFLEGDLSALRLLTNFISLSLFENEFNGGVPAEFGKLKKLESLLLAKNEFTGPLPLELGSWTNTIYIDVFGNSLNGSIPPHMCKQGSLRVFSFSDNMFFGEIPANYVHCKTLEVFMVTNNSLSGVIPPGIWGLPNAGVIDVSLNQFEGPISSDIKNAKSLQLLFASNNRITGELPREIFQSKSLIYIDLFRNQISGEFPCDTQKNLAMSSLEVLDLSYNNMTGLIPECLTNFQKLSVLSLVLNDFRGNIPTTPKGCQIKELNLNGNQLEGPVPRSLTNCRNLEVLDIGNNKISDNFPHWLDVLQNLQVLVLHANKFHGLIENCSFTKLRIIDASNNNLSGPLPIEFIKNLEAMINVDGGGSVQHYMTGRFYYQSHIYNSHRYYFYYSYSVNQTIKGNEIKLEDIQTTFTSIDLSYNKFEGEIPEVIAKLSSLIGFSIAHNFITGCIPPSIANLTKLEWLDLSSNKLFGEIPMRLADLTFLEFLNLSWNRLVGPIPQGRQFNTFDNGSYEGNNGLCGFPMTKSCRNYTLHQLPVSSFQDDDEFADGFGWKAVLLGYGCGTIFGMAIGYLVFQTDRPKWFVPLVEGRN